MKIRKHKNNRTFRIISTLRSPGRTETHVDETGKARKVVTEGTVTLGTRVFAVGSCKQSVTRAFLTGRDAHNISVRIEEVNPLLVWTGRRIVTTITPITALEFNSLLPV